MYGNQNHRVLKVDWNKYLFKLPKTAAEFTLLFVKYKGY